MTDEEKYPNRWQMGHSLPKALQEVTVTVSREETEIGPAHPAYDNPGKDTVEEGMNDGWYQEVMKDVAPLPPRAKLLREAEALIVGDRNNQYGPPDQDFNRTANLLTVMGYMFEDSNGVTREIREDDIARIMIALKLSRGTWANKKDNWLDIAGYAACGYEVSRVD